MDWTAITTTILSGITIGGVVEVFANIRFRKERAREKQAEAKQKEAEAKVSGVEAQKAEIDLADMYKDKVLELLEQVSSKQDDGNANQRRMLAKLDGLDQRVSSVELYLNGEYQRWKAGSGGRKKGAQA